MVGELYDSHSTLAEASPPAQDHHVSQAPVKTYGTPRQKKNLSVFDSLSVTVVLVCLVAATVTISPRMMVAWRLGLKRQLQITGFLLSIMNLCLNVIAPKVFLMSEARFGSSYIQNYDAILRNSIVLSHTGFVWRVVLYAMIALPNGLSIAYKEFIEGSHNYTLEGTSGYYGLAAPGQLAKVAGNTGMSLMVNATLPFSEVSANDSILPDLSSLPLAYGFNMLLLSESSTAFLDGPMPDYISSIQENLTEGESQTVSAQVYATISTYNNTVQSFRTDSYWWDQYVNFEPSIGITYIDLYNNMTIGLLVNSFDDESPGDKSWCFIGTVPVSPNREDFDKAFKSNALEFNTRRDTCQGTWTITRNGVELISGHCNLFSLPDSDQKIITNTSLGFEAFYMPTLSDFLGPLAKERNTSEWLLPTFTTTVAAMYWSRITGLKGYYNWGDEGYNDTYTNETDPYHFHKPQLYYPVKDTIVSTRITMDPSWVLYFILAIQPILTILLFLTALTFSLTPLDGSGFGITAILAGVRHESLNILQGASLSGRLSKPVRMQIAISEAVADARTGERMAPEVEYVMGGTGENNKMLEQKVRYRMLRVGKWMRGFWGRISGRERNQYEMFSMD